MSIDENNASVSDEPPRKIVAEYANELQTQEEIANVPSYAADCQAINRAKNKVKPKYPIRPETLGNINLPEILKYTLDKKRVDEGSEQGDISCNMKTCLF